MTDDELTGDRPAVRFRISGVAVRDTGEKLVRIQVGQVQCFVAPEAAVELTRKAAAKLNVTPECTEEMVSSAMAIVDGLRNRIDA